MTPIPPAAPAILAAIMDGRSAHETADLLRALADQLMTGDEGPFEPCHFRYRGRIERLKPTAFSLLMYLWPRRHRGTQTAFAINEVWGVSASDHALRAALANINLALAAAAYPQRVRQRGETLIFE